MSGEGALAGLSRSFAAYGDRPDASLDGRTDSPEMAHAKDARLSRRAHREAEQLFGYAHEGRER